MAGWGGKRDELPGKLGGIRLSGPSLAVDPQGTGGRIHTMIQQRTPGFGVNIIPRMNGAR